jgi:hypothetical protein
VDLRAFAARVGAELQRRGTPFDPAALLAFVEDSRHTLAGGDDPDPARWANAFLKRQRVEALFNRAAAAGAKVDVHTMEREE